MKPWAPRSGRVNGLRSRVAVSLPPCRRGARLTGSLGRWGLACILPVQGSPCLPRATHEPVASPGVIWQDVHELSIGLISLRFILCPAVYSHRLEAIRLRAIKLGAIRLYCTVLYCTV